jgi:hypothetical protein
MSDTVQPTQPQNHYFAYGSVMRCFSLFCHAPITIKGVAGRGSTDHCCLRPAASEWKGPPNTSADREKSDAKGGPASSRDLDTQRLRSVISKSKNLDCGSLYHLWGEI